ncbi:MAG: hypothetical protein IJ447_04415 [Clostridia bacterium]|nr:hypothetical protein [Clostridia bacterium]
MKKKDFVSLVLGTVGGLFFALGMCMCLLPEWNSFKEGVVMGVVGAVILLVMLLVRRKMEGKPIIVKLDKKSVGTIVLSVAGALTLGVGMCMVMVWEKMLLGIVVGIIGIVLLLALIPVCKGIK